MASTTHSSHGKNFNNLITLYQTIMGKDGHNLAPPQKKLKPLRTLIKSSSVKPLVFMFSEGIERDMWHEMG